MEYDNDVENILLSITFQDTYEGNYHELDVLAKRVQGSYLHLSFEWLISISEKMIILSLKLLDFHDLIIIICS